MKRYLTCIKRVGTDEKGATAIEYGLLAALIAVAIIGALQAVSRELILTFSGVASTLETATTTSTTSN